MRRARRRAERRENARRRERKDGDGGGGGDGGGEGLVVVRVREGGRRTAMRQGMDVPDARSSLVKRGCAMDSFDMLWSARARVPPSLLRFSHPPWSARRRTRSRVSALDRHASASQPPRCPPFSQHVYTSTTLARREVKDLSLSRAKYRRRTNRNDVKVRVTWN